MVAIEPIVELAHEMESVFRSADRAGGRLSAVAVDVLLQGMRAIEERVRALSTQAPVVAAPRALLEALSNLESDAPARGPTSLLGLDQEVASKLSGTETEQLVAAASKNLRAVRLRFAPSSELAAGGTNITSVRERIGRCAEIVKVVPRATPPGPTSPSGLVFELLLVTEAPDARLAEMAGLPLEAFTVITAKVEPPQAALDADLHDDVHSGKARRDFVRVDVARLDETLERLSALIVNRFKITRAVSELSRRGVDVRELSAALIAGGRQLRDLRSSIMRARMVPFSELLQRAPLVVRGAAKATGKKVRLDIVASAAELDKAVAERVFPAIVHIIRNAVDHAIETPETRRALGKSEEGLVEIRCLEHANNQLEITIRDDGNGIGRTNVANRAGVPVPASDAELLELLVRPGLSTSHATTQTSGRGMGMDIVKRIVVEQLGGQLSLRTEEGVGSTFILRIPLSLTIVEAFTLVCGAEVFVVPVAVVDDILELDPASVVGPPVASVNGRAPARMLMRRGRAMPLFLPRGHLEN